MAQIRACGRFNPSHTEGGFEPGAHVAVTASTMTLQQRANTVPPVSGIGGSLFNLIDVARDTHSPLGARKEVTTLRLELAAKGQSTALRAARQAACTFAEPMRPNEN